MIINIIVLPLNVCCGVGNEVVGERGENTPKFRCKTIWQSNFTDRTARVAESVRFLLCCLSYTLLLLLFYVYAMCVWLA
jgi:hypothetical protein